MQVTVTIRVTTDSLFQLDESRESPAIGALWFYDFMLRFTLLTHAAFPLIRKAMFHKILLCQILPQLRGFVLKQTHLFLFVILVGSH